MGEPKGFRRLEDYSGFYHVLHPRPTVVLISVCEGSRVNGMAASWVTPVSEDPPTIGVAIDRGSYTYECLESTGEVTINIPGPDQADVVYGLGSVSGRRVDKVSRFNLKLGRGVKVKAPLWLDALASIEARVHNKLDVGECRLYVFSVEEVWVREDLVTSYGWDYSKTTPLLHGTGRTFYGVGQQLRARKP